MSATDSFDAIVKWLEKNGGDPTAGYIDAIYGPLRDVHERLMKVRCISPTVDLTDRMWTLMKRAGLPVKPIRQPSERIK